MNVDGRTSPNGTSQPFTASRYSGRMSAAATASAANELRSFRLATPVVQPTNRVEVTAVAVLSVIAMTTWLLVLPAEVALRFTV